MIFFGCVTEGTCIVCAQTTLIAIASFYSLFRLSDSHSIILKNSSCYDLQKVCVCTQQNSQGSVGLFLLHEAFCNQPQFCFLASSQFLWLFWSTNQKMVLSKPQFSGKKYTLINIFSSPPTIISSINLGSTLVSKTEPKHSSPKKKTSLKRWSA